MDSRYVCILVALQLLSFVRYSLPESTSTTTTTTTTTTTSTTTLPTTTMTTRPTTVTTEIYTTAGAEFHEPCHYYRSSTIGLGVAFSLSLILNIILIVRILRRPKDDFPRIIPHPDEPVFTSMPVNDYSSPPANENRAGTVYDLQIRMESSRKTSYPKNDQEAIYTNGTEFGSA